MILIIAQCVCVLVHGRYMCLGMDMWRAEVDFGSLPLLFSMVFLLLLLILTVSYCLLSSLIGQTSQLASRHCAFFNLSSENYKGLHAFVTSSLSTEKLSQC